MVPSKTRFSGFLGFWPKSTFSEKAGFGVFSGSKSGFGVFPGLYTTRNCFQSTQNTILGFSENLGKILFFEISTRFCPIDDAQLDPAKRHQKAIFRRKFLRILRIWLITHRSGPIWPDKSIARVKTTWIGLQRAVLVDFLKKPKSPINPQEAPKRDFGEAQARPWRPPETSNLCCRLFPLAFGWCAIFSSNGPKTAEIRTPQKRDFRVFWDFDQNRRFPKKRVLGYFPGSTRLETASNRLKTRFWGFQKIWEK